MKRRLGVSLAVVRDLRSRSRLGTAEEVAAFEQDLLAEFVLARSSAGVTDGTIRTDVSIVVELREWFGRPLWQMQPQDLDRFFGRDRRELAAGTKARKAAAIGVFFEFLELRHKPAIHAATGWVVESPLDEVNRPRGKQNARLRIPPSAPEVDLLFAGWREDMGRARKYAPVARNYTAARLSSLIGPRISELCLLRMGDLCWDLGRFGKILVRGKGSRGRGKKERLLPLINGSRALLEWWVGGPRWDFDDLVNDPDAPLFPSERRNADGSCAPVTDDALRAGLTEAVARHRLKAAAGDQLSTRRLQRIGTVNAGAASLVLPAVRAFQAANSRAAVEVRNLQQDEIHVSLAEGTLDLGLVNLLDGDDVPPDLEPTPLLVGRPAAVLPVGHPLAAQAAVSADDLRGERFVAMRSGYLMYRFAHRLFGSDLPAAWHSTDGAEMGKMMVAEGIGLTVLPDYSVLGDPLERAGLIVTRPLVGDTTVITMTALHRRQARVLPAILQLLGHLRERARQPLPARTA